MNEIIYKNALEVLKVINLNGFKAYIIGGYPRSLYLGQINNDVDICTNANVEDLIKIFGESSITKRGFGSIILKYNDNIFELTTFRKELSYINNRYPKYEYTEYLEEDLKRRDFIINTLCIDENGKFIDLLGAKNDIDNKLIRCVGNAYKKIEEDSLRIVRAFRFSSDLGFNFDEYLELAISKFKYNLNNISIDKIKKEIEKVKNKDRFKYLVNFYNIEFILENDLI